MRRCQRSRGFHARFFIAAECDYQITRRRKTFSLQPQKGAGQRCDAIFVIKAAPAEEIAVFLDECKGVAFPVFGQGVDNVHMSDQQDGLSARRVVTAVTNDKGCGFFTGGKHLRNDMHVFIFKSAFPKSFRKVVCDPRYLAVSGS